MLDIQTPVTDEVIDRLRVGDIVYISGSILCGRDAVLPKLISAAEEGKAAALVAELQNGVIFHTAVSPAGVGPTSSNKLEIESSIGPLSKMGIKIHLGKGKLHRETVERLDRNHAVYAVIPPVTALLKEKTIKQKVIAFAELGMEALHLLEVIHYPAIIAVAHGKEIYG